jgi:DNA-directed RNA polymerase subunit D
MAAEKKVAEEGGVFKMEIRLLDNNKDENKLSFILKDSNASYANALRRVIMEEVPVMAIEDVELRKNSSILYDEMVAHRLGLIPLTTDLKSYNLPDKCKCDGKGCARCQVKMTLQASKGSGTVYASEIKSKDSAIKPVFPKMPIVKLLKNQQLEIEAVAMLGRGKVHSKWCPGLVYYRKKPVVEIRNVKNPEEVVDKTHGNIFEIKNGKLEVIKENLFKYDLAGIAEEISDNEIKVSYADDFIFNVESWGQLSCKEIVKNALDIFNEQLDEFVEEIRKAK